MMAVIDRHISFGMEGQLFTETKASLYGEVDPPMITGFVAGLGGRDVTCGDLEHIATKCYQLLKSGKVEKKAKWINLRA
jgi:pyruvate ferredoxin oxidoreductase alpha subunit